MKEVGECQKGLGERSEKIVLGLLRNRFEGLSTRLYVNKELENRTVPDFVFAVKENENARFVIVEVKSAKAFSRDGRTRHSDCYEQVSGYRKTIQKTLKKYNKYAEVDCIVVSPNCSTLPSHLERGKDGVKWMSTKGLERYLKMIEPLEINDEKYSLVKCVFENQDYRLDFKLKYFLDKEQKKIVDLKSGGVRKIKGMAGTGKTLVLAKKMTQDIQKASWGDIIYLTHNINLVNKFSEYFETFLEDEGLSFKKAISENGFFNYLISTDSQEVNVWLCNFDKFITKFVSCPFQGQGPHFSRGEIEKQRKLEKVKNGKNYLNTDYFKKEREIVIDKLTSSGAKEAQYFDAVYIDEFQDCRIDGSRWLLVNLFTKKNDDKSPNLYFTEDPLQSYVKMEALKDLDEEYESIKRKDFLTYSKLGLSVTSNVSHLTYIYRTPEKVFRTAIGVMDANGILLKRGEELKDLLFKNRTGEIEIITSKEFYNIANAYKNRFEYDDLMCIKMGGDSFGNVAGIKRYHFFNVRGLEAKKVFIFFHHEFYEKPHYLYTLMCRTQNELFLVEDGSGGVGSFATLIDEAMSSGRKAG